MDPVQPLLQCVIDLHKSDPKRAYQLHTQLRLVSNPSWLELGMSIAPLMADKQRYARSLLVNKSHMRLHRQRLEPLFKELDVSLPTLTANPFDFVEAIVYLNLEHRKDRNAEFLAEMQRFDVPHHKIHRFNAIHATPRTLGCSRSHIAALELAIKNQWSNVMICEDDFTLLENEALVKEMLQHLFENYGVDYDVFLIAGNLMKGVPIHRDPRVLRALDAQVMAGYIVNRRFYEPLMKRLKEGAELLSKTGSEWVYTCDQWWKALQPSNKWFITEPVLAYQRASFSDIAGEFRDYHKTDKKIVHVETVGGLGNQLFQIANALSYCMEHGYTLQIYKTKDSPSVLGHRITYWDTLFQNLVTIDHPYDESKCKIYKDTEMGYRPLPALKEPRILLKGYYQSYKYFWCHRQEIIELLIAPKYMHLAKTFLSCPEPLAFMHIRRGDYTKLSYHPVLPIHYYNDASYRFDPDTRFMVFCEAEDAVQVRKEFEEQCPSLKNRLIYVDQCIPDHIQMLMMSQCAAGGILANSSFSCWAMYIGCTDANKTFVAPQDNWFADPKASDAVKEALLPTVVLQPVRHRPLWIPKRIVYYGLAHERNHEAMEKACAAWSIEFRKGTDLDMLSSAGQQESMLYWFPSTMPPKRLLQSKAAKVLMGPHFFVFPIPNDMVYDGLYTKPIITNALIKPKHNGNQIEAQARYICLSQWVSECNKEFATFAVPLLPIPFGLDTMKFRPSSPNTNRTDILVYFKHRKPEELQAVLKALQRIEPRTPLRIFQYGSYQRDEYMNALKSCKCGIWIGGHESQGFGVQEALATNVPLLVWNVRSMYQEIDPHTVKPYHEEQLKDKKKLLATSVPYWCPNNRCGSIFYDESELLPALTTLLKRVSTFDPSLAPRAYVREQLSLNVCMNRLLSAFQ